MVGDTGEDKARSIFLEHVKEAAQRWIENQMDIFEHPLVNLCESPIEQIMLAELTFCPFGYFHGPHEIHDPTMPFEIPDANVVIIPQYEIRDYRVDFAILLRNFQDNILKIVVECDGHDFHEKTKQQAKRDKKRDRDLQAAGWKVLRFTGSEIVRDVNACVNEIYGIGADWIERSIPKFKSRGRTDGT